MNTLYNYFMDHPTGEAALVGQPIVTTHIPTKPSPDNPNKNIPGDIAYANIRVFNPCGTSRDKPDATPEGKPKEKWGCYQTVKKFGIVPILEDTPFDESFVLPTPFTPFHPILVCNKPKPTTVPIAPRSIPTASAWDLPMRSLQPNRRKSIVARYFNNFTWPIPLIS